MTPSFFNKNSSFYKNTFSGFAPVSGSVNGNSYARAAVTTDSIYAQSHAIGHNDYNETSSNGEANPYGNDLNFVLSPQSSIKFVANINIGGSTSADSSFGSESSISHAYLIGSPYDSTKKNTNTGVRVDFYSINGVQYLGIDDYVTGKFLNDFYSGHDYQASFSATFLNPTDSPSKGFLRIGAAALSSSHSTGIPITPVPEPQTYAMMLIGLGFVGFNVRKNQKNKT